eukprot:Anaeramoba_ignava/c16393_g1_i3.p1 GENE.c16393_g1_i3~~c16393_g1_i3.p1  ORF type:complete len:119 (-),score=7.09 c16393_g1_i3:73-429(-)
MMAAAQSYNKAAFIYWKHAYYRDAIEIFIKSEAIYEKHESFTNLKAIYTNIGVLYTDLQEIELAETYFRKALDVARKIGIKVEIASGLSDLAYILSALGKYDESNEKWKKRRKVKTTV